MLVAVNDMEEVTSGLEERVDWDRLESMLGAGLIYSKSHFWAVVATMMGNHYPRHYKQRVPVLDGLFPEYREKFSSLPHTNKKSSEMKGVKPTGGIETEEKAA